MSQAPPMDYRNAALLPIGWERFHQDSLNLSNKLKEVAQTWHGLVAITRGGLVPAMILARSLDIRKVETLSISSYDNRHQGEGVVLKAPEAAMASGGAGWLVVDDLADSGATVRLARELLPKGYFVAVYAKPLGAAALDLYAEEIEQAVWVVFPWDGENANPYPSPGAGC